MSFHMTQAGVILGTAPYMSPEQARGKPVDARTDVWAFGCVLFEMLSGKAAYGGETVTDILGAIVHKEPDWSALPRETPAHVVRVLRRCLVKDPRERFHAIGDVRIALAEDATDVVPATPTASAGSRGVWLAALLVALAAGVIAGRLSTGPGSGDATEVRRYSLGVETIGGEAGTIAVTSDGRTVVYPGGNPSMLYVRRIERFESTPLPGTEGALSVVLSPDDQWVAFTAGTRIKKTRIDGGRPITLHDFAPAPVACSGGSWSADGMLYLGLWVANDYGVLYRVPATGGVPEVVVPREDADGVPMERQRPQLLPGERALLYSATRGNKFFQGENAFVRVLDLETGREKTVLEQGAAIQYLASGHLLAGTTADQVIVVPLDRETFDVAGPAVQLPREIATSARGTASLFHANANGTAVFQSVPRTRAGDELLWLGLDGSRTSIVADPRAIEQAVLSPEGRRVALAVRAGRIESLEVYDLERKAFTSLVVDRGNLTSPAWSPDGSYLYYLLDERDSGPGLYRSAVDGSTPPERIADPGTIWLHPTSVSPDGRFVATHRWDPDSEKDWDIWIVPVDGSEPTGFLAEDSHEEEPRFSPDGKWLAFSSDRTGIEQVFVKRFPEQGALYQVSDRGGEHPMWAPDGSALYFFDLDKSAILQADLDLATSPRIASPVEVLEIPAGIGFHDYLPPATLAPDGSRFLVLNLESLRLDHLGVIENWFAELQEMAPVGSRPD
jgi:serine/threonine-protein kinase